MLQHHSSRPANAQAAATLSSAPTTLLPATAAVAALLLLVMTDTFVESWYAGASAIALAADDTPLGGLHCQKKAFTLVQVVPAMQEVLGKGLSTQP
jgi:hypothetical protein